MVFGMFKKKESPDVVWIKSTFLKLSDIDKKKLNNYLHDKFFWTSDIREKVDSAKQELSNLDHLDNENPDRLKLIIFIVYWEAMMANDKETSGELHKFWKDLRRQFR